MTAPTEIHYLLIEVAQVRGMNLSESVICRLVFLLFTL